MRHLRMVGLVVTVFAIAAVAATSASALPEFGKCEAKAGGKYTDGNCTKKASLKNPGSFEWKKGSEIKPIAFSGGNLGSGGVLITKLRSCVVEGKAHQSTRAKCKELGGEEVEETSAEAIKIECQAEHNSGEISGSKSVVNVDVVFTGCKVFGSAPCSNGPNEGEIQVNPLKGSLGYINKAEHKAGLVLEPVTKHGEFAKFNCAGILETVVGVGNSTQGAYYLPETTGGYDGIISPITPVNTMTSEYTQVFTVNPTTVANIPSKFEGKHIELLEDYVYNPSEPGAKTDWSAAGEEITNVNKSVEAGEIKA
jgi:hypothetical protein